MPKDLNYSRLLDFYGSLLTEKQCEILDYYYNEDLSLSEISENLGISRQGAMDIIHRAKAQLDFFESKLKLTEIHSNIDATSEIIKKLLISEHDDIKKGQLIVALKKLQG